MNSCNFTGNLGRDPELRALRDGSTVCNFSLAVKRRRGDDPLWLDVSVWGRQGESCAKYLAKGSEVGVSGEIDIREYERRDGTPGFALTLNARQVTFLGGRNGNDGGQQANDGGGSASAQNDVDDDVPF